MSGNLYKITKYLITAPFPRDGYFVLLVAYHYSLGLQSLSITFHTDYIDARHPVRRIQSPRAGNILWRIGCDVYVVKLKWTYC